MISLADTISMSLLHRHYSILFDTIYSRGEISTQRRILIGELNLATPLSRGMTITQSTGPLLLFATRDRLFAQSLLRYAE
jgi:hypothetical protein